MFVVRIRVLAMFVLRRFGQGSGRRRALEGMRELRNSARGKNILVIGSGPSASALLLAEVAGLRQKGELLVVATNHFLASNLGQTITPDFLVWSDDGFHPSYRGATDNRWELVAQSPETTLVAPWTWKSALDTSDFDNPAVFFDDDSLETWSRNISPLKPRGYQGTTGAKALAFAVYLGGNEVNVIGLDLSYFKNFTVGPENTITRHPTHLAGTDSGKQDLTGYTLIGMADQLYSTANHFRAFHTHFAGKNIVNLDPHSLVDAFDKKTDSPLVKKT